MRWNGLSTRSVTVFLQTDRFRPKPIPYLKKHVYKSVYYSDVTSEIYTWVDACLEAAYYPGLEYKKAGVILSDLKPSKQIPARLFDRRLYERQHSLAKIVDEANFHYGRDAVRSAALEERGGWQGKSEHRGNDSYQAVGRDVLGQGKVMSRSMRFL
jgi:DNA polymerase V